MGMTVFMIGKPNHAEVKGVVGESPDHVTVVADRESAASAVAPDGDKVAVVIQTTLSADDASQVMDVLRV